MDIKIIGAGPAGLSLAYHAKKNNLSFRVFESTNSVGGNCKTLSFDQFKYDLGAHRFHDKDDKVTKSIKAILGNKLIKVSAPSKIYYRKKMINFPLEFSNIFQMLNYSQLGKIFMENIISRIKIKHTVGNFKDLAYQYYGKTLSNLFLINYTEKLWGDYSYNLDPTISGNRLKNLNLMTVINSIYKNKSMDVEHLDGSFYYPIEGFGDIFESIKDSIGDEKISYNSIITGIIHDGKKIKNLNLFNMDSLDIDQLFCTIPLNILINILQPAPPKEIIEIVNQIKFRSVRLCVITLDQMNFSENASIYFPESIFPFTRIYEPKNRSEALAPKGKTCIVIEVPCNSDDTIYQLSNNEFVEQIKTILIDNNIIDSKKVINSTSEKIEYAYPILSIRNKDNIKKVFRYLEQFKNLHLLGRSAQFKYLHTHDLFKDANNQIEKIIH